MSAIEMMPRKLPSRSTTGRRRTCLSPILRMASMTRSFGRAAARVVFVSVVVAAPRYRVVVVAAKAQATPLARTLALVVLVAARRPEARPLVAPARPARVKVFVPVAAPFRHIALPKTPPHASAQEARRAPKASRDRARSYAPGRRPHIFTPMELEAIILTSDEIASRSNDERGTRNDELKDNGFQF